MYFKQKISFLSFFLGENKFFCEISIRNKLKINYFQLEMIYSKYIIKIFNQSNNNFIIEKIVNPKKNKSFLKKNKVFVTRKNMCFLAKYKKKELY